MFRGKNILLISPQYWESREISKHHYARELAANGAFVYYLNPLLWNQFKFGIKYITISTNLVVVNIYLPLPKLLKFHFTFVYRTIFRWLLLELKKSKQIKILWNFDNGSYFQEEDLFNDCCKIFQPVDDFNNKSKYNYKNYDIGFSVSENILKKIPLDKKFFINHGLQKEFLGENFKLPISDPSCIGYVGNLSIHCLDQKSLNDIVSYYPDLNFYFIGDFDEDDKFIKTLKNKKNTHFLGLIRGKKLFETISRFDILLICYKESFGYKSDNSHKLLEYLATGNVVISSYLSSYKEINLFPMSLKKDNSDYTQLFEKAILNFNHWNSNELRKKRQEFAFENTYTNQIKKIEKYMKLHLGAEENL